MALMAPHDPDLEKAAQWLMDVEEVAAAKAALLDHMHEEQQNFDSKMQEENVGCAQLCLEEFLNGITDDDPRYSLVLELRGRLEGARAAFRKLDFKAGSREAGSVARDLNEMLRP
jgi:hypothetical protein